MTPGPGWFSRAAVVAVDPAKAAALSCFTSESGLVRFKVEYGGSSYFSAATLASALAYAADAGLIIPAAQIAACRDAAAATS